MSFLIPYSNVSANNLWIRLNSPTSAILRNCSFVDSLNGWAAGDSGVIIHTSNGGNSFIVQNNPVDYYIHDIFFINKRLGWVVSNEFIPGGTTIVKTTNGGVNWTAERFPDSTKIFRTIYFLDSLHGYLGGFGGAIYKTTDAGISWFASIIDTSKFSGYPIAKFKFVSSNFGFACGGHIDVAGVVWKTTNAGLFWKAEGLSPEPFYDMFIKDSQRILAVGGDYEFGVQLSRTSNSGLNWVYESLGMFGQSHSIDFRTPKEAWMPLGFAQSWAASYDSGRTWLSIPTVDSSEIYSVAFVDSLHGWAVGKEGVILKYNATIVSSKENKKNKIAKNFALHQNYPNPFNPKTIINYEIPITPFNPPFVKGGNGGFVSLKVYDALGKEIATLVNKEQSAISGEGKYSVNFDGSNYPGGIYFYVLKVENNYSNEFSETRKMLLLK